MPSCTASPLEDRLRDALYDYDNERRESGHVVANELGADNDLWKGLGGAIVDLARLISRSCRSSCSSACPGVETLTVRLSEAIDDQLDLSAWRVVDAAARLSAAR